MPCGRLLSCAKFGLDDARGFPITFPWRGVIDKLLNIPNPNAVSPFGPPKCCDVIGLVVAEDGTTTCNEGGGIGMFGISCAGGNAMSGTGGSFIPHGGGIGGRGGTVM